MAEYRVRWAIITVNPLKTLLWGQFEVTNWWQSLWNKLEHGIYTLTARRHDHYVTDAVFLNLFSCMRKMFLSSWCRHQMETFSALQAICAGNSPVPVDYPHKDQWRGALMFSLICTRINCWVNNGEAGDLRRHRAHYDVTVMFLSRDQCWKIYSNR